MQMSKQTRNLLTGGNRSRRGEEAKSLIERGGG